MLYFSKKINGKFNCSFDYQTLELRTNESSGKPKEILRLQIINRKYLEKSIDYYKNCLNNSTDEKKAEYKEQLDLAKEKRKRVNQFIREEIEKCFEKAIETKEKLKESLVQKKYFETQFLSLKN